MARRGRRVGPEFSINPETDCWEWARGRNSDGYGWTYCSRRGRQTGAHRVLWERYSGVPVPEGAFVLHKCDNRGCVNPDHLYIGDHAQNMRDMSDRERSSNLVLSASDVEEIRGEYQMWSNSGPIFIAHKWGVSVQIVKEIAAGRARAKEGFMRLKNMNHRRFSDEEAAEIKESYSGGWGEMTRMAERYGCTPPAIRAVLSGISHGHVLPELSGSRGDYLRRAGV
jgi:hypothetical protein